MLCFICIFASAQAFESDEWMLQNFVEDLIHTWHLRLPTVIFKDVIPELCMRHQWVLCLDDGLDKKELSMHLGASRQDGIIFVGEKSHEELLKEISKGIPSLLRTDNPVFMPISNKNYIELRLDSNILFYKEADATATSYELYDIFAVKSGPSIILDVGKWDTENGILLKNHLNRFDRRTDLKGATFANCLVEYSVYARFIKDKNGNIVGSKGWFQDILFYIAQFVNLKIETVEAEPGATLYPNGTWNGGIGLLQRRQADTFSVGLALTQQRSRYIEYGLSVDHSPATLHAKIPKGGTPNVWVYLKVFGIFQWIIFLSLLVLLGMGLYLTNVAFDYESGMEFKLNSAPSCIALTFLYTIQMGSHPVAIYLAPRLITLTISMITLLFFVFYTGDITAEMTSGDAKIPIRTFEDVILHEYKVVTDSPYYKGILSKAKPGTAMHTVYQNQFEATKNMKDSLEKVIKQPKTLYYTERDKNLGKDTMHLTMDDAVFGDGSLALQKNSEFLQLFNHYILKGLSSGVFKKVFRKYHMHLFINQNYEMIEPQPLGFNNVMFCSTCLAFGMCISVVIAIAEKILPKKYNERGERAERGRERDKAGFAIVQL